MQKRVAGVTIPLFSLRGQNDYGSGDFGALVKFLQWAHMVGLRTVQILPINELGRGETSPYSAFSAFALDPLYLDPEKLAHFNFPSIQEYVNQNHAFIGELRQSPRVQAEKVKALKLEVLRKAFALFAAKDLPRNCVSAKAFEGFVKENDYWLDDYLIFRILKEQFDWKPWSEWPDPYKNMSSTDKEKFINAHHDEALFFAFVQWQLSEQLKAAAKTAREKGIMLCGDIPLLISMESADVFFHQDVFNLSLFGGAPPDQYAKEGQDWHMPTYRWDVLEKNDYEWWKRRLKKAEEFYSAFRIDHVVGLFRIWSIPDGKTAKEGYFDPSDENSWADHGRRLLQLFLRSTNMLPLAEDLGVVPNSVRPILKELYIPGLKVWRWERAWNEAAQPFLAPSTYDPMTVATLSTHDSETFLGWLENPERSDEVGAFAQYFMHRNIMVNLRSELTDQAYYLLIKELFSAGSNIVLLLMPDLLGLMADYRKDPEQMRINRPDKPGDPLNWNWRMPFSVEALFAGKGELAQLNFQLTNLVEESNRSS